MSVHGQCPASNDPGLGQLGWLEIPGRAELVSYVGGRVFH